MVTTSRNVVQTGKAVGKAHLFPGTDWNNSSPLCSQYVVDKDVNLERSVYHIIIQMIPIVKYRGSLVVGIFNFCLICLKTCPGTR